MFSPYFVQERKETTRCSRYIRQKIYFLRFHFQCKSLNPPLKNDYITLVHHSLSLYPSFSFFLAHSLMFVCVHVDFKNLFLDLDNSIKSQELSLTQTYLKFFDAVRIT